MIWYDPSEARKTTKLPRDVIKACAPLPGLEKATGADILVSPVSTPGMAEVTGAMLHRLILTVHCARGMLVQRKSGWDLVNSIPKLAEVEAKMLEWTDRAWLVFIGTLGMSKDSMTVVNGKTQVLGVSGMWQHKAVRHAIDMWQMRGGYYHAMSRAGILLPWLQQWEEKLKDWKPEKSLRQAHQTISRETLEAHPGIETLMVFPGIGHTLAAELLDYTGRPADAFFLLSDENSVKLPGRPRALTRKKIRDFKCKMGLEESEILLPLKGEHSGN